MTKIANDESAPGGERQPAPGPAPLTDEEKRRLDLKMEREARRQAEVGQIVRGETD